MTEKKLAVAKKRGDVKRYRKKWKKWKREEKNRKKRTWEGKKNREKTEEKSKVRADY